MIPRIIELLIDEALSGDTRVEEVALVEFPAIEVDAIYFSKYKFFRAPQYVADKACQAIRENEKRGNPAGTQVGKIRAQQLCKREEISLDTIKRMKSFLERASTYDTGNWDDNGTIAMGLWGGGEALVWVDKILEQEKRKSGEFDYDVSALPDYDQYPSGDTKNNMLVEPILFVKVKPGETEQDYVSRCMGSQDMISEFPDEEQRAAVCYSTYERKDEFGCGCMEKDEEMEIEPNPCWSGYEPYGLKDDGSPNCIPVKNSKQEFDLLGYIDGIPYFSSPEEAESYGEETYGCEGHHIHTDEEGNEVYMSCTTHEELPDGGVELEELLSQGWRIEEWNEVQKQEVYNEQFRRQVSKTTKEDFYRIVTEPNSGSILDFGGRKVRFVYLSGMGEKLIPTSRDFCKRMLGRRQFVFRYEDILKLNAEITAEDAARKIIPRPKGTQPDIFTWKGGANCRHYWAELIFSTDNPTEDEYTERINNDATREINKASVVLPAVGQSGQVNPKASSVRGARDGA